MRDLSGKVRDLQEFQPSKGLVIVFWSTWNSRCLPLLERLRDFMAKYPNRGLEVITINAEGDTYAPGTMDKIKTIVAQSKLPFPVLLDAGLKAFRSYELVALPQSFVITGGKISYQLPGYPSQGGDVLFDTLLGVIGEPTNNPPPAAQHMPPSQAVADVNMARKQIALENYSKAYLFFKKAIALDPLYILPYVEMAKLFAIEDKWQDAEKILNQALTQDPKYEAAQAELGYVLSKTNRAREGVALLSDVTKVHAFAAAHYYLGFALGQTGDLKAALASFGSALELNPFDPKAFILRAETRTFLRDDVAATASDYRRALELMLGTGEQKIFP